MRLADMKIATGRTLVAISKAERPLSVTDLTEMVARDYEKRHDSDTMLGAIQFLKNHALITNELSLTEAGKRAAATLNAYSGENQWAYKFFRPSDSPNVGPRAPSPVAHAPHHLPQSNLTVVR